MGFNSQTLELINLQVEETCAALQRIETQVVPKSVDWSPDQKPIRFIDALDRKVNLPYEYCTTWKVPMIIIFDFFSTHLPYLCPLRAPIGFLRSTSIGIS
jgi:hypothetical protein